MSGLETLPPDQRAVLQLILVQGRGYADLAATLKLDAAAVRERAHAGAAGLGLPAGGELDAATRGRVVDYLLGQQDDGERLVTYAELGESPAACRWAQALRERLAGVAREELPEVPAGAVVAVTNGNAAHVEPAPVATPPAPAPATMTAPPAPAATSFRATPPPPATPPAPARAAGEGPRPSRVGGAILIAGAAALAIVLAVVLIGRGDDGSGSAAPTTAAQAQRTASARTQPTTTPSSGQASTRPIGQTVLRATPDGGSALGAGLVLRQAGGRRAIAIEAARLPANGPQDVYGVWLDGTPGATFLGFVPNQVRADGTFTITAPLPANAGSYATVLITREGTTATPTAPGTAILSGPLRLTG